MLTKLPLMENSPDFVFDNQMLAQCVQFGFRIGEVSCPTKYFAEASSINFRRSVKYGLGVLGTSVQFKLHNWGVLASAPLQPRRKKAGAGSRHEYEGVADGPAVIEHPAASTSRPRP